MMSIKNDTSVWIVRTKSFTEKLKINHRPIPTPCKLRIPEFNLKDDLCFSPPKLVMSPGYKRKREEFNAYESDLDQKVLKKRR